ncbi:DNA methyltransferase [Paenibacillus pseudetheri]|uniref:DNA methyltransferase n=1 Tax=Paenibacillus pseudetheri TaxID=2897682 RepID=UPI00311A9F4A
MRIPHTHLHQPGETVLDNYAGSCTTAVAASRTGRKYIALGRDERHAADGMERLKNMQLTLF